MCWINQEGDFECTQQNFELFVKSFTHTSYYGSATVIYQGSRLIATSLVYSPYLGTSFFLSFFIVYRGGNGFPQNCTSTRVDQQYTSTASAVTDSYCSDLRLSYDDSCVKKGLVSQPIYFKCFVKSVGPGQVGYCLWS